MKQLALVTLVTALFVSIALCSTQVDLPDVPIPARRFYVGGQFSELSQTDGTKINANNIAYFDNGLWSAYGNGTDGTVHAISVDLCRNVYVGGEFTMIDGVQTGPIAKYDFLKGQWEALGSAPTLFSQVYPNKVLSISSDCINIPNIKNRGCNCDVLIAGDFRMNIAQDDIAQNVAQFTADKKSWSSLGSGDEFVSPARAIYKRQETSISDATDYIWVGGDFGLKAYRPSNNEWTTITQGNVVVNSLAYIVIPLFWKTDTLLIAGSFSFACEDGKTCNNVASYDRKTKKFAAVGTADTPSGIVHTIDVTRGDIYIGGDFTGPTYSYVTYLPDGQSRYATINGASSAVKLPVRYMKVCGYSDPGCPRGSMAITGRDQFSSSYLAFYNRNTGDFLPFGNSTTINGIVNTVEFAVTAGANTIRVSALAVLVAIAAIFMSL